MHELLRAWRTFKPRRPPHVLPGDEALLRPPRKCVVTLRSWRGYSGGRDFGGRDACLHLGLLPIPFAGHLDRADVVILMLNPGLKPVDYFAEYRVTKYRRALLANLRQRPSDRAFPNPFLDPAFAWHSGFVYWHRKLGELVSRVAEAKGIDRRDALALFSRKVAFLELYPYHSTSFRLPPSLGRGLRSPALAKAYVRDVLLPRARSGRTLLVVTRKAGEWGLRKGRGIVVYGGGEARGAHLTPGSRGGKAILRHLLDSVRG